MLLSNRDMSLVVWAAVFIVYVMLSRRMVHVRKSLVDVARAFLRKKVIYVVAFVALYFVLSSYVLFLLGLWDFGQLRNTIVCFVVVGLFHIAKIQRDGAVGVVLREVVDSFSVAAIIGFLVDTVNFSLTIEILLVPVVVLLAIVHAVVNMNEDLFGVRKYFNAFYYFICILIVARSVYVFVIDFWKYLDGGVASDFMVPILLIVLYIPGYCIIKVVFYYEVAYLRMDYILKNRAMTTFQKILCFVLFNFRTGVMERWLADIQFQDTSSLRGFFQSILRAFRLYSVERKPLPSLDGCLSPYKAKRYLEGIGLKTGYYKQCGELDWFASSDYMQLGESVLRSNIAYYVEGEAYCVRSMKIILNLNSINDFHAGFDLLAKCGDAVFVELSGKVMPDDFRRRIEEKIGCRQIVAAFYCVFTYEIWERCETFKLIFSRVCQT